MNEEVKLENITNQLYDELRKVQANISFLKKQENMLLHAIYIKEIQIDDIKKQQKINGENKI